MTPTKKLFILITGLILLISIIWLMYEVRTVNTTYSFVPGTLIIIDNIAPYTINITTQETTHTNNTLGGIC